MSNLATVAPVNRFARAFHLLWLYMKRPFLLRRVRTHTIEHVNGVPLVVWPDVLNPVVFRSGAWFARVVASDPLIAPASDDRKRRLLDMGTGSGVCAVFAARRGFRVTAVDINPEAVRCATINALLNGVEDEVKVLHGDLFDPVAGREFDVVLFNPPFFRGEPKTRFELAWRATDVFERFAAALNNALAPAGKALILLSTDGDAPGMLRALEQNGFHPQPALRRDFGSEVMTIYLVERSS